MAAGRPRRFLDHDVRAEGIETGWRRSVLLGSAIPGGLAVGVAFGAAGMGGASLGAAVALAIGIGLQNFPG